MRNWNPNSLGALLGMAVALGAAGTVCAQNAPQQPKPTDRGSNWEDTKKKAAEIGAQPARDLGASERKVPAILQKAYTAPYDVKHSKDCRSISREIAELNKVLGDDYASQNEYSENRAGKIAEAGGKTLINSVIPFRGVIREITGAAPDDRRMSAAVDAGLARRGFLRGISYKQGCRKPG